MPRNHLLHNHPLHLRIRIQTQIFENYDREIPIAGLFHGAQDRAARAQPREDECLDVERAENNGEIGAVKGGDTALGYGYVC